MLTKKEILARLADCDHNEILIRTGRGYRRVLNLVRSGTASDEIIEALSNYFESRDKEIDLKKWLSSCNKIVFIR